MYERATSAEDPLVTPKKQDNFKPLDRNEKKGAPNIGRAKGGRNKQEVT